MATAGPEKDAKTWTAKCTTCGAVVLEAPQGLDTSRAVEQLREAAVNHSSTCPQTRPGGPIAQLEIVHHVRGQVAEGLIRRGRITED